MSTRPGLGRVVRALRWAGVGIVAAVLWPSWLGGVFGIVLVEGHSMEPTLRDGELVLTHERGSYSPGDAVVYRVPAGEFGAGALVVHRIASVDASGRFTMLGDNRVTTDQWRPRASDVRGEVVLAIPVVGRLLANHLLRWMLAATVGLASAILCWPRACPGPMPDRANIAA